MKNKPLLILVYLFLTSCSTYKVAFKLEEKNKMPSASYDFAYQKVGSNVYFFGGLEDYNRNLKTTSNTKNVRNKIGQNVFKYEIDKDSWELINNTPHKMSQCSATFYKGRIYIFGNYDRKTYKKMSVYNVGLNKWEKTIEIPFGLKYGKIELINNKFYFLGFNWEVKKNIMFTYNLDNKK